MSKPLWTHPSSELASLRAQLREARRIVAPFAYAARIMAEPHRSDVTALDAMPDEAAWARMLAWWERVEKQPATKETH